MADEPATVVWLANFCALEWHPWTSPTSNPHEPSYALIDLDRGEETTGEELLTLARLHRTALEHVEVRGYPKITGRGGLQIWIPVVTGYSFDDTRHWVRTLSRAVGGVAKNLISWKWEVADRAGKARLDYTQNAMKQDAGGSVQSPCRCRGDGVCADHVGRAGRSGAGPRDVHHS